MATTIQGYISDVTLPNSDQYPIRAAAIPYGEVDSTSTSTAYTATIPGIYSLVDGVCVMLKNGIVTSASGFTININNLGAKPVYSNMATGYGTTDPTRDTTIFNINYTMLLVYSTDIVSGGGWICYRGYDANTNTIGYQLRTNATVMNVTDTARYYKMYFMNTDNTGWVPASINSTNNATTARPVNQRPINPFGRIVYTSASTNYTAGANLAATSIWDQYTFVLGYSFNNTGKALNMTVKKPVYLKCAPQTNGSAIMDADNPIVQSLPSSADGKIYIYLGVAYDATHLELVVNHPVYYHDGSGIKIWGGSNIPTKTSQLTNDSGFITEADIPEGTAAYTGTPSAVSTTAAKGTSNAFARGDHIHNITGTTITDALGYTPYNSTNPNGYTSNTGTVTGVTAGTGLKVGTNTSGGTISTSGTINHINSVTAKTTQGLYPITYDAQGHITGSGNAVAIPTASSTTPLMDGTAAVGSGTTWARSDHRHPSDTAKVDVDSALNDRTSSIVNMDGAIGIGSTQQNITSDIDITPSQLTLSARNSDITNSLSLTSTQTTIKNVVTPVDNGDAVPKSYVDSQVSTKQATLVSGTNIKTVNGNSLLGSGDLIVDSSTQTTWWGTSSTTSSTAEKAVDCEGFTLTKGAIISVLFTTGNTASVPTLNVNSTGVKSIYVGANLPNLTANTLYWSPNTILMFVYDGTYFRYISARAGGGVRVPDGAGSWYGTSSTVATTAAKIGTIPNFRLMPGARVSIVFSTANTYINDVLTLNINATGAYTIYVNNAATSATNTLTWDAGECLTFIYSGSYYYFVGRSKPSVPIATASTLGGIKVGSGLSVTSDGTLSASSTTPSAIDSSTIHTKAVAGWGSVANITSGEGVQF